MEYLYSAIIILVTILLAVPLGRYISKVFKGEKTFLDLFEPLDKLIFKASGINPLAEMDWKQNLKALLTINLVWFIWIMFVLLTQRWHPFWNPDNMLSMEPTQAFNTAVSFVTNTNLQHYSGETGASYFSQLLALVFLQFVSAGTGIAALALLYKGLANRSTRNLGNFYYHLVRACTRILLPLSIVLALVLLLNQTPMTFKGSETIVTLQGDTVSVARGPVAAMVAIKQLGTNGGGFFGPNSTHPFENPNGITNAAENSAILLIPIAMVFALGYYLNRKKLSYIIMAVMSAGYLMLLIPTIVQETGGNTMITQMGIVQTQGSMEGKEARFGPVLSALWSISTTVTSNGSVNSMHDSFTALSGAFQMMGMQLNAFYGGVGVGFINMFIFMIIAVFISGLMVGRTPEFLGKKIEVREVKIAILVALLHPLLILGGTALASHTWMVTENPGEVLKWLNNPGYHGFSEMLYEFTSASANNGSGFEGLGDNTPFWNISAGVAMLLGRYIPIIGPIMIAGLLSQKKYIPESAGTLKLDSGMFGVMLFAVILILGALLFIPALLLGPVSEYLTIIR
ncbi:MAG TPA: potassium-transporting ATPase subunit KdpA [Ignavibacteria bacterium]|nr:potassium-transporting ATPase subunit A [Bacteroidota bacterium]HRE10107.1 potassium-transporting ATPase subunit KdpA [Ignavibacteria bacterium]HRF67194.1 potassium-transporting ATPase subunit KdpA [Ignavibacteria bacterium]HRJ03151.1 potassium-transporting ATPase subunit KdpA [Ignavibacteria bacterium]